MEILNCLWTCASIRATYFPFGSIGKYIFSCRVETMMDDDGLGAKRLSDLLFVLGRSWACI